MKIIRHTLLAAALALAASGGAAQAQISDNVIKIGVLSDMSSLYTDLAGAGSVVASQPRPPTSSSASNGVPITGIASSTVAPKAGTPLKVVPTDPSRPAVAGRGPRRTGDAARPSAAILRFA